MKALTWTAVTTLLAGVAVLAITVATWPAWNPALAYLEARNAAEFAGAEVPDAAAFLNAPVDFYALNIVLLVVGGLLVLVGATAAIVSALRTRTTRHTDAREAPLHV